MNPRLEALKLIIRTEKDGAYLNRLLDNFYASHTRIDGRDRALVAELAYGVVRHKRLLDFYIQQVASRPLHDIDPKVLNILRIGLYQIIFLSRIPEHAAVSETVSLARSKGGGASRFVNAVLRQYLREQENLEKPSDIEDPIKRLGTMYSFPDWMVREFRDELGQKHPNASENELWELTEARLKRINTKAHITIRVNTLKTSREEYLELLAKNGVDATAGEFVSDAVIIRDFQSLRRLPGYKEGLFMVQDEGSMLAVRMLSPSAGETVLDIGAAPGGKTTYMAQLMKNEGKVVAVDINAARVGLIQENAVRLGLTIIGGAVGDATEVSPNFKPRSFDRVMIDAPCTGFGVLRRHPEGKWQKKQHDKYSLAQIQKLLLESAATYVKKRGVIVYSVCTTTMEEGPEQIERFLDEHPEFALETPPPLSDVKWPNITEEGFLDLSDVDGVDGFFAARLRRKR